MPSLSDLTRAWLLRQLGLSSSNLTEADLQTALYGASPVGGAGLASNLQYAAGRYYSPTVDVSTGTIAAVNDRLWVVPFEVGQFTNFDRIATEVTTVGTTGNVGRLGVYGTVNGLPGSLIVDAGTFDATILGAAEKVINIALNPGLYWLGYVSQIGVAANVRALGSAASRYVGHTANPLSNGYKSYRRDTVAGALPADFGTPVADTSAPKIFMRAA
jgi:hypothetical protein